MIDSTPGLHRLRAASPADWIVADKAGTYGSDETNDYALAWPPGGPPIVMAAYYHGPGMGLQPREAVPRQVGAVIHRWWVEAA